MTSNRVRPRRLSAGTPPGGRRQPDQSI